MTSGSVGASTSASLLQSLLQQIASQTQSKPFPTATSATGLSSSPAPSPSPTVNPVASSNPSPLTVSEVLNGLASIFQNAAVAAYATSNGVKPTPTASSPISALFHEPGAFRGAPVRACSFVEAETLASRAQCGSSHERRLLQQATRTCSSFRAAFRSRLLCRTLRLAIVRGSVTH